MSKGFAGPAEYATEAELQRATAGHADNLRYFVDFSLNATHREAQAAAVAEITRLRAKVAALQNAIRQLVPGRPDETDEA